MALFKTDPKNFIDASQIETVGDRGDGNIVITARRGAWKASCPSSIATFNAASALIQISDSEYVPAAGIAEIAALPSGAAQITTFSGRVIATSYSFATIAAAVSSLTP